MAGSGEGTKETIRPAFDGSIMIDFQGAKNALDTGFLLLREIDDRFSANQARLLMGLLAYNLLHLIREFYLKGEEVKRSIEWLIKRLVKVGARVSYHVGRRLVHVASAFPLAHHYRAAFG
jgi:hypothetical protein